jgi:RHS repeat-associated protein
MMGTQYEYNDRGYQTKIVDATAPSDVYYEVKAVNARGQVTQSVRGNNASAMTTNVEWDPVMGRLQAVRSGANNSLQNWEYSSYDPAGNLLRRKDLANREENFVYDDMNRIKQSTVSGVTGVNALVTTVFEYDLLGNLTRKGSQYQASGIYVDPVTGSGTVSNTCQRQGRHFLTVMKDGSSQTIYCYDANGNQISASADGSPISQQTGARRIQYTVHDKPSENWTVNQHFTRYRYGPNHEIVRRSDGNGAENTTTVVHYVGGVEVYIEPNTSNLSQRREYKRNIGGFLIINLKRYTTGGNAVRSSTRRYVFQDKLGSTDVITDKNGVVQQRMSFDVWGQRRADTNWAALTQAEIQAFNSTETRKGYTGHEMVDKSNLIHMGGRIYDPLTARFLNADIVVQAPHMTQSYNRYAYVLNNPMNYTDPSGYSWLSDNWRSVAAVGIAAFAPYAAGWLTGQGLVAVKLTLGQAIFTGMISGGIGSGSLRGALTGGLSAGLMHGIGSHFAEAAGKNVLSEIPAEKLIGNTGLTSGQFAAKIAAHAAVGGVTSVLNGGKFGHGFASAGVVEAFSPALMRLKDYRELQILAAAVVGGTASVASGGKFANGAKHAAAMWVFNHMATIGAEETNVVSAESTGKSVNASLADVRSEMAEYKLKMKDGSELIGFKNIGSEPRFDFNCHGFSVGDSDYWIQDNDMQQWLETQNVYKRVIAPSPGMLVVFRENGNVKHSAIVANRAGHVINAAAVHLENGKKVWEQPILEAWPRSTSIEYWSRTK